MSTTRGIRTLAGVALASSVFMLAGCSSSGTVGGKSAADAAATSVTAPSSDSSPTDSGDPSPSDPSSSDGSDSSGGLGSLSGGDAGCQAAETDVTSAATTLNGLGSDPTAAVAAIKGIGDKLNADAAQSSNPAAAAAIKKLGDDYVGLSTSVSKGQMPDTSKIMDDATAMMTACAG